MTDFVHRVAYTTAVWLAVVMAIALWVLPFGLGNLVNYPFKIFTTVIHEFCHGLAAVITGGSVVGVQINGDGSGHTKTLGGWMPLIASAGYLGTTAVGLSLLTLFKREMPMNVLYAAMGTASGLAGAYALLYAPVTFLICGVFTAVLFFVAFCLPSSIFMMPKYLLFAYLCVQLLSNSLSDFMNLLTLSATTVVHTDAVLMAAAVGGTPFLWAFAWTVCSGWLCWHYLRNNA